MGIVVGCIAVAAGVVLGVKRHQIDWGDAPTWGAPIAAVLGGTVALYQLREQRRAITDEFARQAKRDALLDAQLEQSRAEREAMLRAQAEQVDLKLGGDKPRRTAPRHGRPKQIAPAHSRCHGVSSEKTGPGGAPGRPADLPQVLADVLGEVDV